MSNKKKGTYQQWYCVLNVILVEGINLVPMNDNGYADPFVKLKLENEKYRSKVIVKLRLLFKSKKTNVRK